MRSTAKTLRFPLAGVAENLSYRDSTYPREEADFATPFATNVRGKCTFGDRARGGSRPGLALVQNISSDKSGKWLWPNGEAVLWPDGGKILLDDPYGNLTMADGSIVLPQHNIRPVSCSQGVVPQTVSAQTFYRARHVLASGANWYASRSGDVTDWNYGHDAEDSAGACYGNLAYAAQRGDSVTAFMNDGDRVLYAATAHSLFCASGDVYGGMSCVSEDVGCVGPNAWCNIGHAIVFLSNEGVYTVSQGGVKKISDKLPDRLAGITAAAHPLLIWDPFFCGVHIFTDSADYWIDMDNGSIWPVELSLTASQRPTAGFKAMVGGVYKAVFFCADGLYRTFDETATKDCGTSFASAVCIGPFRVSARDDLDGLLDDVVAATGVGSAPVGIRIYSGRSAEEAVAASKSPAASDPSYVANAGWSNVVKPRVRGAWCVIRIDSVGRWAYESIHVSCKQLGRLR